MKERVLGLVFLVIGAGMAYLCIYMPLEAASRQDESISLYIKGAALCPLAFIFGLLYLVLGERVTGLVGTREKPKPAAYAIGILAAAVGIAVYFGLQEYLKSQGYQF